MIRRSRQHSACCRSLAQCITARSSGFRRPGSRHTPPFLSPNPNLNPSYSTIPYPTLPTLSYPTLLLYPTLPYPTLPYPTTTLPYGTSITDLSVNCQVRKANLLISDPRFPRKARLGERSQPYRPYRTVPYRTLPCPTLTLPSPPPSYPTHPTLPYLALPHPSLYGSPT